MERDYTEQRFECEGFRAVMACDARQAAEIFAQRLARREFGRNGRVGALRLDTWSEDGSTHRFEAFVGRHTGAGDISGHNSWLFVHRA